MSETKSPKNKPISESIEDHVRGMKRNLMDLIELQDGLRGIGYSITDDCTHKGHVESMSYAVVSMANLVQRLTNQTSDDLEKLVESVS